MSDNRRRFIAIHSALKKLYSTEPRGNLARHLTTFAMLISGMGKFRDTCNLSPYLLRSCQDQLEKLQRLWHGSNVEQKLAKSLNVGSDVRAESFD